MIPLFLALLGCGSLNEPPDEDSQVEDSRVTPDTEEPDSGTGGTTDTETDTFEPDPSAPTVASCDAWCYRHKIGHKFYEWNIDCTVTDPDGAKNIWNGRWACTSGGCSDQSGLVACTKNTGACNTSFKETQVTPPILCQQASSYTFTIWVSDWDGLESKGYKVTGRQQ